MVVAADANIRPRKVVSGRVSCSGAASPGAHT